MQFKKTKKTKKPLTFFLKTAYNNIAGSNTLYTRVTEFAFKRHVMSSGMGPPLGGFLLFEVKMNIFVYSDESGVFDKHHNDLFVFGGLILLGSDSKEKWSRLYSNAEKTIRRKRNYNNNYELKATNLLNQDKNKLYRSLNNCHKFGVVIRQKSIMDRIFISKKDKQRYLDYAYKIAVKRAFESLIKQKCINADDVERIYFYVDEHTTATNGCYELREGLEQEFKYGTYNATYSKFYPPIFTNMKEVRLEFCNSASKLLVRAADIVANKIFYIARTYSKFENEEDKLLHIIYLP